MESGCPSPDRWQSRRKHCTGAPLCRFPASRVPCVDRVGGAKLRLSPANVGKVERAAGANVCLYRGVELGSCRSPLIKRCPAMLREHPNSRDRERPVKDCQANDFRARDVRTVTDSFGREEQRARGIVDT